MTDATFDAEFITEYRACCVRILSGSERPYDVAGELMWVISEYLESVTPAVLVMWGELHDACDFGTEAQQDHAEALMREAASEFLTLPDYDAELDAWAARWVERIVSDSGLRS
jgi:hypothetical protein